MKLDDSNLIHADDYSGADYDFWAQPKKQECLICKTETKTGFTVSDKTFGLCAGCKSQNHIGSGYFFNPDFLEKQNGNG